MRRWAVAVVGGGSGGRWRWRGPVARLQPLVRLRVGVLRDRLQPAEQRVASVAAVAGDLDAVGRARGVGCPGAGVDAAGGAEGGEREPAEREEEQRRRQPEAHAEAERREAERREAEAKGREHRRRHVHVGHAAAATHASAAVAATATHAATTDAPAHAASAPSGAGALHRREGEHPSSGCGRGRRLHHGTRRRNRSPASGEHRCASAGARERRSAAGEADEGESRRPGAHNSPRGAGFFRGGVSSSQDAPINNNKSHKTVVA